jgi:hypothetical protein
MAKIPFLKKAGGIKSYRKRVASACERENSRCRLRAGFHRPAPQKTALTGNIDRHIPHSSG